MKLTNKNYQRNRDFTVDLICKLKKKNRFVKLAYSLLESSAYYQLDDFGYERDVKRVYSFFEHCLLPQALGALTEDNIIEMCAHVHLHLYEAILKDKSQSEIDEFFEALLTVHSSRFVLPMFVA